MSRQYFFILLCKNLEGYKIKLTTTTTTTTTFLFYEVYDTLEKLHVVLYFVNLMCVFNRIQKEDGSIFGAYPCIFFF